jgi:hypothetical protein
MLLHVVGLPGQELQALCSQSLCSNKALFVWHSMLHFFRAFLAAC